MVTAKRSTIYFEPEVHRALKLRAAGQERTVSDIVNEAVKLCLAEDADDLEAIEERQHEPDLDFATVVKELKKRGKI